MAEMDMFKLFCHELQEFEIDLEFSMDLDAEQAASAPACVTPPGLKDGSEQTSVDYKLDCCAVRPLPAGPVAELVENKKEYLLDLQLVDLKDGYYNAPLHPRLGYIDDKRSSDKLQDGDVPDKQPATRGKWAKDEKQKECNRNCMQKARAIRPTIKKRVQNVLRKRNEDYKNHPESNDPYTQCVSPYLPFIAEHRHKSEAEQWAVDIPFIPNW